MEGRPPFTRLKVECNPAIKPGNPGRFVTSDSTNELVLCYMKAAMHAGDERGYLMRWDTKHKYVRVNDSFFTVIKGTVYVRSPDVVMSELESMVEMIHMHAEILYDTTLPKDIWRLMYDRNIPRETYP